MCRGSGAVAARKKLTTINLPGSSSELAVGVHLVTHLILQRGHVLRSALRQDLGRDHLQVLASPDLSGRSLRRPQMGPPADLRLIATNSQIWLSFGRTDSAPHMQQDIQTI